MSRTEWGETPEPMRSLDAIESVRSHPEWFFRGGEFDAGELVSLLVQEAFRAGSQSVQVEHMDGWVGVSADRDWLDGDLTAFYSPVSYPEGGRNSARAEVALTAFCDVVLTGDEGEYWYEIKSTEGSGWTGQELQLLRLIAGRFPSRAVLFLLPNRETRSQYSGSRGEGGQRMPHLLRGEVSIGEAIESFLVKLQDA